MLKKISLNGAWKLRAHDGEAWLPASVPGSVYNDLIAAGLEDPYWRDNEIPTLKLMDKDYIYARAFELPEELPGCSRLLLRCEGLDTLATVTVNDKVIGRADNMHRIWEFDIKDAVHAGQNEIQIRFASPTRYIAEEYAKTPADGSSDCMVGFPLLRKAHCMFGWDWGPRLPDAGIWRDISIVGVEKGRIRDVYVAQRHEDGRVYLNIRTALENAAADCEVRVFVTSPGGKTWSAEGESADIVVEEPELWWPNGQGAQPLYTVRVEYGSEDAWEKRIGLRTLGMHIENDEWGQSFAMRVNGRDIFAMGADYIPEDNILPRVNPQRTRRLLEDAAHAHFNVIRVWGGGYYPDDWFYDACDELGLVVWQDMMFACAVYNLTPEFEANITAELTDNVRRLRHHASLGLWCGNNEMEMFVDKGEWVSCPRQKADYIKMYEYIFPRLLEKEDPQTFYWPASPSSGGSFDFPNDSDRGDVHYWEVWHGGLPFTDYRNHLFRFVSEFGFQSFPCMETIKSFTLPGDRNVFSYVMEKHQRNASANSKIVAYLAQMYRYPRSLELLVYASQLLQAQAMQYGVEHWRRNRGRCMGAVVWQLNDCWPVASWSSIDYYGRWKALHYYEKRFFAPVLLSCEEEGVLSQQTNVNAEGFIPDKRFRLNVSNETASAFSGKARWTLRTPDSSVIRGGEYNVEVAPYSALWLDSVDCNDCDTYSTYCSYALYDATGNEISSGSVLFCPPKHFNFIDPKLSVTRDGDALVVKAAAYARSVELLAGPDVLLEDNYFDMDAGERRVKILRNEPAALSVLAARSVYDIG